jgi:hypothetical protein
MVKILKKVLFLCPFLSLSSNSMAGQLTIGADLIQPFILGGWNLNGYYYFDNDIVFGWSHGDDLKVSSDDSFAPDPVKESLSSNVTDWSTGPEIGYRLGKYWDLRLDLKAHYTRIKFESNPEPLRYRYYSSGPSVFYNWFPFSKDPEGFVVQLSARYWFYVGDDFDKDDFTYVDKKGTTQKHNPEEYWNGALSGFGANIAFGWAF